MRNYQACLFIILSLHGAAVGGYSYSRRRQNSYTPYGEYIVQSRKYSNKHVNSQRSIHTAAEGKSGGRYPSGSKSSVKCIRGERGPPGRTGRSGSDGVCPSECIQPDQPLIIPEFIVQSGNNPISKPPPVVESQPTGEKAGFAVALSGEAFADIGSVVLFDTHITDNTHNFDFDTGAFTAKVRGMYQFSASGTQSNNNKPLHFTIKRGYMNNDTEDDYLCSAQSNGKYQTCSCQSVVSLEPGQKVYVKLIKGDMYANDYHYTTFSGFQIN